MALSTRLRYTRKPSLELTNGQQSIVEEIRSKLDSGDWATEETSCFCGETEGLPVADQDSLGLPHKTLLCPVCGLLRANPALTNEAAAGLRSDLRLSSIYGWALDPQTVYETDILRAKYLQNQLSDILDKVKTVVEIGARSGGTLSVLAETAENTWGCEWNPNYVEHARKNNLNVVAGGVSALPGEIAGRADVVLLSNVIRGFTNTRAELEEAIALLAPGGILLVLTPGIRNEELLTDGDVLKMFELPSRFYFTGATLAFVLESLGLEVILSDDVCVAAARKPPTWAKGAPLAAPSSGESQVLLSHLAAMEQRFILGGGGSAAQAGPKEVPAPPEVPVQTAVNPWPINTTASLRILAWPDYSSIEGLKEILLVSEPLFERGDAVLCLRYDATIDIPVEQATANLEEAFQNLGKDTDINVLLINDPIAEDELLALGKSLTAALHIRPDNGPKDKFIHGLGITVITGDPNDDFSA